MINVVAAFIVVVLLSVILFPVIPFSDPSVPVPVDAADAFRQLTGWALPQSTQVLISEHTHGGFKNDGRLTVAVRIPPRELSTLLPNDSNTWHDCPIASEIARGAWSLPNHSGTIYYARKTSDTDKDWHRGYVVIVNPDTGRVWLHEWKS